MSGEIQDMLKKAKEKLKKAKGSERQRIQDEIRALELMLGSKRMSH